MNKREPHYRPCQRWNIFSSSAYIVTTILVVPFAPKKPHFTGLASSQ
jgi:hypothetical protein